MKHKIMALINLILILTSISGFAYAHWSDTIYISGTIKMAYLVIMIDSYKRIYNSSEFDRIGVTVTDYLSPDNRTLQIDSKKVYPCWYIWVGLLLHNKGTVSAKVKAPIITLEDSNNLAEHFNMYFYGPYTHGEFNDYVWGKWAALENLPKDGTKPLFPTEPVSPPVPIDPCQHVVLWTWIHFDTDDNNEQGKTIKILITIVDDPFYL